jgi:hypothetical protein
MQLRGLIQLVACVAALAFSSAISSAQPKKDAKDPPPQIIVAMPLAASPGTTTKFTLRGVRLDTVTDLRVQEPKSSGKLLGKAKKVPLPPNANPNQMGDSEIEIEISLPKEVPGGVVPFAVVGPDGESKPHHMIVRDDTPVIAEKEPNDGFKQAQPLTLPCAVEGSIKQPQDVDVFRIEGKQGQRLTVEVQARRFGSPVDGMLTLYDQAGRTVAAAEAAAENGDPVLNVTLPRDGVYFLGLIDANDQGGSIFVYRLIVRVGK